MRGGISKPGSFAIALALALLIVASAVVYTERGKGTASANSTTGSSSPGSSFSATNSSASNSTNAPKGSCGLGVQLIPLNATEFCADDVANDTVLGAPGYSYFRNGSITFMGVTFQTFCPSEYMGCPGANSTAATVMLGIMRFTMTFPDKTKETAGAAIGDLTYVSMLSNHSNPRAGMLIEITYGAQETTDHVFLLVAGSPVATVTVTETLATQGSRATTTYAVPTNCNFTLPTAILTTTTITVWPTPPVSTTTTTVTTTSTSYTQTVTVTSCTYIVPTVTSTVTTTANP